MSQTLFTLDAITASLVLIASLWPLSRAVRAVATDCREQGTWLWAALGAIFATAVALRFWAVEPTLLVHAPGLHQHISRLFDPLGPAARWHPFHGMGGFVLQAAAARIFGESLTTLWTVHRVLDSLTPILVYLLARRLFASPLTGVLAAALLAVFPPQLRLAASEQLAVQTVFFSALAYCAVLEGLARPGRWTYLAAAVALAAAAQQRAEVVSHLMFCVLLVGLRVRGEPWPRLDRWFFTALGLCVLLCVPRVLASVNTMETFRGWFSFAYLAGLLVSPERHIYLDPGWTWPLYPLLTLTGLVWLAARRQWRLLVFFVVAFLGGWLLYLNQWTLDPVEALRFQGHAWFLFLMVAGFGLARLVELPRPRALRGAILILGLVAAGGSVATTWPRLHAHTATSQDLGFFSRNLHRLPPHCALYLLRPTPEKPGSYGPGRQPRWVLGSRQAFAFPADLRHPSARGCRVAYLGADCHTRYPSDYPATLTRMRRRYESRQGPALYTLVDQWLARLDRKPPGLRKECRWVRRHYRLEPLVTTHLEPGYRTLVWTPRHRMSAGFYRLHPRP